MEPYLPVLITVSYIVLGIIALRVFFTLWEPIDQRFHSGRLKLDEEQKIEFLKDKTVDIAIKGGAKISGVVLRGFCKTHYDDPYDLKQLLLA